MSDITALLAEPPSAWVQGGLVENPILMFSLLLSALVLAPILAPILARPDDIPDARSSASPERECPGFRIHHGRTQAPLPPDR